MHCPVCRAENKEGSSVCQACGASLGAPPAGRRARNPRREPTGPVSAATEARIRAARIAFRVSVLSLVPGLGLVLGPAAVLLGTLARQRGLKDPQFTLWGPVYAAIFFGAAVTVCNWAGFILMFLGLRSAGLL